MIHDPWSMIHNRWLITSCLTRNIAEPYHSLLYSVCPFKLSTLHPINHNRRSIYSQPHFKSQTQIPPTRILELRISDYTNKHILRMAYFRGFKPNVADVALERCAERVFSAWDFENQMTFAYGRYEEVNHGGIGLEAGSFNRGDDTRRGRKSWMNNSWDGSRTIISVADPGECVILDLPSSLLSPVFYAVNLHNGIRSESCLGKTYNVIRFRYRSRMSTSHIPYTIMPWLNRHGHIELRLFTQWILYSLASTQLMSSRQCKYRCEWNKAGKSYIVILVNLHTNLPPSKSNSVRTEHWPRGKDCRFGIFANPPAFLMYELSNIHTYRGLIRYDKICTSICEYYIYMYNCLHSVHTHAVQAYMAYSLDLMLAPQRMHVWCVLSPGWRIRMMELCIMLRWVSQCMYDTWYWHNSQHMYPKSRW